MERTRKKEEGGQRKRKGAEGFIARYRHGYLTQEFVAIIVVHCTGSHFFWTTGDVQYLSMKRDLRAEITTGVSGGEALILHRGVGALVKILLSLLPRYVLKNGAVCAKRGLPTPPDI